jgi:hypothetical protein
MTDKREKTSGRESGAKVAEGSLPSPDDEWSKLSQREKFIRTAREVGADETGETLDETLRAIGRAWKR